MSEVIYGYGKIKSQGKMEDGRTHQHIDISQEGVKDIDRSLKELEGKNLVVILKTINTSN